MFQFRVQHVRPKRWTLLTVLQASGSLSIRELVRRVRRDVENVHADVRALIDIGLIERAGGMVRVPFDEIRAAFSLVRAA